MAKIFNDGEAFYNREVYYRVRTQINLQKIGLGPDRQVKSEEEVLAGFNIDPFEWECAKAQHVNHIIDTVFHGVKPLHYSDKQLEQF